MCDHALLQLRMSTQCGTRECGAWSGLVRVSPGFLQEPESELDRDKNTGEASPGTRTMVRDRCLLLFERVIVIESFLMLVVCTHINSVLRLVPLSFGGGA